MQSSIHIMHYNCIKYSSEMLLHEDHHSYINDKSIVTDLKYIFKGAGRIGMEAIQFCVISLPVKSLHHRNYVYSGTSII